MLEHVGTISTNLGVVVRLKSCIFRFEDGIGGQFSHLAGNDAWPTIIVIMFVMFVKHWENYIKALSCELGKTWDQEIVDHINMMIIHNIHGIIRITIAEVHMIQTSSLFLQYHEVKVTCCFATVHQKCVGLASTGVCVQAWSTNTINIQIPVLGTRSGNPRPGQNELWCFYGSLQPFQLAVLRNGQCRC